MSTVIQVENLSKSYLISHQTREPYFALRDVIAAGAKGIGRKMLGRSGPRAHERSVEEIWALKDVSFEVFQGDRVGVIGRNGAGKSTLLKVLSRITEPTRGKAHIRGRVSSLLEVGTGFHPELTGRENIFLNGAILGMTRKEISRKFDEIVEFAEIEKFLDTPVKRYSSGMYVRLAFAVAAHLESEILVVDEVLAVGDIYFQKKCLGKIREAGSEGRTVMFVSHNMESLASLCNKGLLFCSGRVQYNGDIREAISIHTGMLSTSTPSIEHCARRGGEGGIRVENLWIRDCYGSRIHEISCGESLSVCIDASVSPQFRHRQDVSVGIGIDSMDGRRLVTCVSSWINKQIETTNERLEVRCEIPSLPLVPDVYLISVSISVRGVTLDYVEHCGYVELLNKEQSTLFKGRTLEHGRVKIPYRFETAHVPEA